MPRMTKMFARRFSRPLPFALAAFVVVAGSASAAPRNSLSSGSWYDASRWSGGAVPGPGDDVTINAAHTMHLASFGAPLGGPITVQRLIVSGTLVSDEAAGFAGNVQATATIQIRVNPSGRIIARDGIPGFAGGGSVFLTVTPSATNFLINNGLIQAGDGENAGSVTLTASGAGYTGSGTVRAGNANDPFFGGLAGATQITAANAVFINSGAIEPLIRGGDSVHPSFRGGNVTVTGTTSVVVNGINAATGPNFKGGNNTSGATPSPLGGDVKVYTNFCTGDIVVNAGARLESGTPMTSSLAPGFAQVHTYSCGRIRHFGSGVAGWVIWDPPTLEMSGDALLSGERVTVAGGSLTASNLNPGAGIEATDRIDILISPGGALDFSMLAPNTAWLRAPNAINISADTITLPPGQTLANLASRSPQVTPGAPFRDICLTPSGSHETLAAGATRTIPIVIQNCGTADDTYTVAIGDSLGWLSNPLSQPVILTAGATFNYNAVVQVPANPVPGITTNLSISVQSQSDASVSDAATLSFQSARPRCIADVDDGSSTGTRDGGVTIEDLLYYILIFEDGSAFADVDDGNSSGTPDGGVTIDDLLYYLLRFESGC